MIHAMTSTPKTGTVKFFRKEKVAPASDEAGAI